MLLGDRLDIAFVERVQKLAQIFCQLIALGNQTKQNHVEVVLVRQTKKVLPLRVKT